MIFGDQRLPALKAAIGIRTTKGFLLLRFTVPAGHLSSTGFAIRSNLPVAVTLIDRPGILRLSINAV
ncbi:MAG TPA: hypothetical protein VMR08_04435 [Patescibacteria group bacterium]|nr:hypothetical protein [Patescibacteria group bacterium]